MLEAMEKMQEAMDSMDPEQMLEAMKDFEFDLVINATSVSTNPSQNLNLDESIFRNAALALDLYYSQAFTPFMDLADRAKVPTVIDGWGMLVETMFSKGSLMFGILFGLVWLGWVRQLGLRRPRLLTLRRTAITATQSSGLPITGSRPVRQQQRFRQKTL